MTALAYSESIDPYYEERVDLAAVFRWTARLNMHEAIANHYSLAVSPDGAEVLINPAGRHFSRVRASDLLLLNVRDPDPAVAAKVDMTALAIHGAMHRNAPQARCVLHVHSKYATAFACLKDKSMPPIDQNTMRFYNRIAYDNGFDGMGLGDEAERLSTTLGNKSTLVMGNHGVMTVGNTVAEAFDTLYYFEKSCETLITALSTGRELNVVSHEVAEKTASQWEEYCENQVLHLTAIKEILDEEEPDYRT
ncbi:MAG: class II aldolase/adducin family protein [Alphaproteobacteria bacterium]